MCWGKAAPGAEVVTSKTTKSSSFPVAEKGGNNIEHTTKYNRRTEVSNCCAVWIHASRTLSLVTCQDGRQDAQVDNQNRIIRRRRIAEMMPVLTTKRRKGETSVDACHRLRRMGRRWNKPTSNTNCAVTWKLQATRTWGSFFVWK